MLKPSALCSLKIPRRSCLERIQAVTHKLIKVPTECFDVGRALDSYSDLQKRSPGGDLELKNKIWQLDYLRMSTRSWIGRLWSDTCFTRLELASS